MMMIRLLLNFIFALVRARLRQSLDVTSVLRIRFAYVLSVVFPEWFPRFLVLGDELV